MDYIQRMKVELEDLSEKIVKAENFLTIESLSPEKTNEKQRVLLHKQLVFQKGYYEILKERIQYEEAKTR